MGIIRAAIDSVKGGLADQWLEVIEPNDMGDQTVFTSGIKVRKGSNRKGTDDAISNGSVVRVYDNQFMLLVDGGKIIDYAAEPGYYTVENSSMPSMFNGQLGDAIKESFNRFKFGGGTPTSQKVFYINLQEIKGIKFGTRNPINYFDSFYNAELFLRAHGNYSIKITDPIRFYMEAIPRNKSKVEIGEINEQYMSEFLEALQTSINQMSADGTRISFVSSKQRELGKYMASVLDEEWSQMRGMEIQSVGIANISYDDESKKLINMRNQGAMLGDPTVREGYVQGAVARGMEAAGSNANGSMAGFMGMGVGMQTGGGFMNGASQANMQQMQMNQQAAQQAQMNQQAQQNQAGQMNQQPQQNQAGQMNQQPHQEPQNQQAQPSQSAPAGWTCDCGAANTGKFCPECGKPAPARDWTCGCGAVNQGKFCSECGKPRS